MLPDPLNPRPYYGLDPPKLPNLLGARELGPETRLLLKPKPAPPSWLPLNPGFTVGYLLVLPSIL